MSTPEHVIIEEIIEDAEKQAKRILRRARRRAERAATRGTKEARKEAEQIKETARRQAEVRKRAILASIDQRVKQRLLEAREDILQAARDEAWREMRDIPEDQGRYSETLVRLIVRAVAQMKGERFAVQFRNGEDEALCEEVLREADARAREELNRSLDLTRHEEPVRSAGGCRVWSEDRHRFVDQTFETRLDRLQDEVRRQIAPVIFPEVTAVQEEN